MVWAARRTTARNDGFSASEMEKDKNEVIRALVDIRYTRNDMDFSPSGTFRVRGDTVEILRGELQ